MKRKWPYIVIFLLLITNLIAFGYVEKYCEVNQQQRDKALLHDYLLKLTNDVGGDINKLIKIYPSLKLKDNQIIINKHSIFRNVHFTKHYSKTDTEFYGFEFITDDKGKLVSSAFYQP